jgi:hypothetical protein
MRRVCLLAKSEQRSVAFVDKSILSSLSLSLTIILIILFNQKFLIMFSRAKLRQNANLKD